MKLKIVGFRIAALGVLAIRMANTDGTPLPAYEPGAHLRFRLPQFTGRAVREYSLIHPYELDHYHYEIAVHLEVAGSGGSIAMHALEVGEEVDVDGPCNEFSLVEDADEYLLIAGGIGITPIISMAKHLHSRGQRFSLHYAARRADSMAFKTEVESLPNSSLYFGDSEHQKRMNLKSILGMPAPTRHVYVCGPQRLISAVLDATQTAGWKPSNVHFESFKGAVSRHSDRSFQVTLYRSGREIQIPADCSILETLLKEGIEPLYDCKRGECGLCAVTVIEGAPEHRDSALTDHERNYDRSMCICISRSITSSIVLDM